MSADSLCACGLSIGSSAARCRSCPHQNGLAAAPGTPGSVGVFGAGFVPVGRLQPVATLPPLVRYSRWKKSSGTFGPVGRVVATVLLLLPLPIFLATLALGIGIIGGGIWIFVIMPWALRDIWRKATIPLPAPPSATPSAPRF